MCFNVSCTVVDLVFHKSFECESYGLTTEFHSKFVSVRVRCTLFSLQRFCQNYVDSIVGLLDMLSMLMCGMSSSRCDVRSQNAWVSGRRASGFDPLIMPHKVYGVPSSIIQWIWFHCRRNIPNNEILYRYILLLLLFFRLHKERSKHLRPCSWLKAKTFAFVPCVISHLFLSDPVCA